jgi:tetratricopeptide (TPR) repeat protein
MRAIAASATTTQAPLEAVLALRSAGLLLEALSILTSQSESNFRLRTMRAEVEFELGRFAEAALSYFPIAISQPCNANVHYNLALCLQRSERWDAAVEAFQRVLRLDADRSDARLGLGDCLLHLNRIEEALTHFDQGLRGPNPERALFGKAVGLQLLGRFDEAARVYEGLLNSDPDSEEVLSNSIAMNIEAHDLERVRDHSLRLLEIRPHSAVAVQGLASVALDTGDNQAAVSYCFRILDLAPDCLDAWHNLRIALDRSAPRFCESGFSELARGMHSGRK